MTVSKEKIANKLKDELNLSNDEIKKFLDAFLNCIKTKIPNKTIKIANFGTFYIHTSPKRIGRNPSTRESYIIPIMKKIKFKCSNKIRKVIN